MKKAVSITKIIIVNVLAAFAILGIFSEPAGNNWLLHLILSKSIGIVTAYFTFRLAKRWKKDLFLQNLLNDNEHDDTVTRECQL